MWLEGVAQEIFTIRLRVSFVGCVMIAWELYSIMRLAETTDAHCILKRCTCLLLALVHRVLMLTKILPPESIPNLSLGQIAHSAFLCEEVGRG